MKLFPRKARETDPEVFERATEHVEQLQERAEVVVEQLESRLERNHWIETVAEIIRQGYEHDRN